MTLEIYDEFIEGSNLSLRQGGRAVKKTQLRSEEGATHGTLVAYIRVDNFKLIRRESSEKLAGK